MQKTCIEVCDRKAIDFKQKEEIKEIEVGTIILTTGYQIFDATRIPFYGYGKYPNVYTSLEVERLVNASGPTGGELILRDGRHPKTVGIITALARAIRIRTAGVRVHVACILLKLAHLLKEHTDAEVYIIIDIRAAGKSYEEFYDKLLDENVHLSWTCC